MNGYWVAVQGVLSGKRSSEVATYWAESTTHYDGVANPTDTSDYVAITESDRRATFDATYVGQTTVSCASLTGRASGKRYFEVLLVSGQDTGTDAFRVCTGASVSPPLASGAAPADNSIFVTSFGRAGTDAVNSSTGVTYANGQSARFAIDFDAENFWIGVNGTWIGGGDPGAGTSPTGSFSVGISGQTLYPYCQHQSGGAETAYDLCLRSVEFAYSVPSGFSAWVID